MSRPPNRSPKDQPSARRRSVREFQRHAREKAARRIKARRDEKYSIWRSLGTFGIVGWSVMLPTVIGLAVGLWLDQAGVGPVPWALVLMLVGLVLGCLNAWYWVQQESRDE